MRFDSDVFESESNAWFCTKVPFTSFESVAFSDFDEHSDATWGNFEGELGVSRLSPDSCLGHFACLASASTDASTELNCALIAFCGEGTVVRCRFLVCLSSSTILGLPCVDEFLPFSALSLSFLGVEEGPQEVLVVWIFVFWSAPDGVVRLGCDEEVAGGNSHLWQLGAVSNGRGWPQRVHGVKPAEKLTPPDFSAILWRERKTIGLLQVRQEVSNQDFFTTLPSTHGSWE